MKAKPSNTLEGLIWEADSNEVRLSMKQSNIIVNKKGKRSH